MIVQHIQWDREYAEIMRKYAGGLPIRQATLKLLNFLSVASDDGIPARIIEAPNISCACMRAIWEFWLLHLCLSVTDLSVVLLAAVVTERHMFQTPAFQVFRLLALFLFFDLLQSDHALSHGAAAEARISWGNGGWAWQLHSTVNHSSAQEAEQKALENCREAASKDADQPARLKAACKIVATFKDKCFALATTPSKNDPGVGWAVGLEKEEAESAALRKCRATAEKDPPSSCRVRQSQCDAVQVAPRQEPGVTAPTYVPTPVQSMSFSRQELEELKEAARTANQISMVVAFFSVLLVGTTIWWANRRIASVQSAIGRVHGGMTRMFTKVQPPSVGSSASGGPPIQLIPSAGGAAITLAASRLGRSGLTIGRDGSCDIVVHDSKVSSRHARIWSDETGKLLVEDLGSSNGVYRNGEKILRASLRPGDVLRLGDVTYTVN